MNQLRITFDDITFLWSVDHADGSFRGGASAISAASLPDPLRQALEAACADLVKREFVKRDQNVFFPLTSSIVPDDDSDAVFFATAEGLGEL